MTIHKVYYSIENNTEFTDVKFVIHYESCRYICVAIPVKREDKTLKGSDGTKQEYVMESYTAYSGFKDVVHECLRRSKKQDAIAIVSFEQNLKDYKDWFINKYQIKFKENGKS